MAKRTPKAAVRPKPAPKSRPGRKSKAKAPDRREISVSEFFTKNRHLLGFGNPRKALLTCVKEAVGFAGTRR
jgi:DNA topoisomerase-6 subunit B